MPNIFITNKCNNNCSYCFMKHNMDIATESYISFDNFKRLISWFLKNENTEKVVRFLGGEPLLHPNLERMIKYMKIKGIKEILIFTNGLLLDKNHWISNYPEVKFVINTNSKKDLGNIKYNILRNNMLNYPNKEQLKCGITVYSDDMDLNSIFTIVKENQVSHLRIGISVPSDDEVIKYNRFEYYNKLKSNYMKIIKFCIENKIQYNNDCNGIPYCLFDKEDIDYLNKYNAIDAAYSHCFNVGDIFLDCSATSCFGVGNLTKQNNVLKFNDYEDYVLDFVNGFVTDFNKERITLPSFEKCSKCDYYKQQICCGGCRKFDILGGNYSNAKYFNN